MAGCSIPFDAALDGRSFPMLVKGRDKFEGGLGQLHGGYVSLPLIQISSKPRLFANLPEPWANRVRPRREITHGIRWGVLMPTIRLRLTGLKARKHFQNKVRIGAGDCVSCHVPLNLLRPIPRLPVDEYDGAAVNVEVILMRRVTAYDVLEVTLDLRDRTILGSFKLIVDAPLQSVAE